MPRSAHHTHTAPPRIAHSLHTPAPHQRCRHQRRGSCSLLQTGMQVSLARSLLHVGRRPARPRCCCCCGVASCEAARLTDTWHPATGNQTRTHDPEPARRTARYRRPARPHRHYSGCIGRSATAGVASYGGQERQSCDERAGQGQPYPRHVTAELHRALASTAVVFPEGRYLLLVPSNGRLVPVARRPGSPRLFFPLSLGLKSAMSGPATIQRVSPQQARVARGPWHLDHWHIALAGHWRWCWPWYIQPISRPVAVAARRLHRAVSIRALGQRALAGAVALPDGPTGGQRPAPPATCLCAPTRWLGSLEQQLRQQNCQKAAGQGTPRATMDQGPRRTRPQFFGRSQMQP